MKKYLLTTFLVCFVFILSAQDEKYQALFVYKFVQNLEFPDGKIGDEYVIGIMGNDELHNQLSQLTSGRKVNGKPVTVKKYSSGSDISGLCILFLSDGNSELFETLKESAQKSSVVLVGETPGLAKKGAALNFSHAQGRLGFEMNSQSLEASNVKSSNSLKLLATLVN